MGVGCLTDLTYIFTFCTGFEQTIALLLVFTYASAFALAKLYVRRTKRLHSGNVPHLITHAGATVLHVWLLYVRVRHERQ